VEGDFDMLNVFDVRLLYYAKASCWAPLAKCDPNALINLS